MTVRISYAIGAFGHDVLAAVINTFLIVFFTNHLFNTESNSYNAKMVGIITTLVFVVRILEIFIDPFIGNIIDRTHTRWGKFKPWVLIGAILSSVFLALLFTDFHGLTHSPIIFFIVFGLSYVAMDAFYSFKDVGFWSMIPAISFSSEERTKTSSFARVGSAIGAGITQASVVPIVLFFSKTNTGGTGDSTGWFKFAIVVAIINISTALCVWFGTKEQHSELRENKESTSFKQIFGVLFHNDQLMWVSLSYLLYAIAFGIINSLLLYYFTFIFGNAAQYSMYGIANVVINLIVVPLFPVLTRKFGRHNVFIAAIFILMLSMAVFAFANQSLPLLALAIILLCIPQQLVFLSVLMTMTDSVEYGQLKDNHRDESLVLSVRPLIDKLAGALNNAVVGLTAVIAGMSGSATFTSVTASDRIHFKLLMIGVPFVLAIITLLVFKKVTLTEKKHEEIVQELKKTWGKNLKE